MEASMYIALMAAALLALAARHDTAAVLAASLASLTRPEGLLLVVTILAAIYIERRGPGAPRERKFPLLPLLGLLPLALWAALATGYYGTPVPHSILAKARPMYPLPAGTALEEMAARAGHWSLDGPHGVALTVANSVRADRTRTQPAPRWFFDCAGAALFFWTMWRWWRPLTPGRSLRMLALPLYLLLLVGFYAVTNPLLFPWYLPLLQCPMIATVVAAGLGPDGPGAWRRFPGRLALVLILSTAMITFLYSLGNGNWSLLRYGGGNYSRSLQMEAYGRAAEWLERNSKPGDTVAATEIGLFGYKLDRRILDSCGLVTPAALPFLPVPRSQRSNELIVMSVDFVRATHPDFIMSLPAYIRSSLLNSDWFSSTYEQVQEIPCVTGNPRFYAALIFRRRSRSVSE
jgi:hypothetical protein